MKLDRKRIMQIVIILGGTIIFFWLGLKPAVSRWHKISAELATQNEKLIRYKTLIEAQNQLDRLSFTLKHSLDQIEKRFFQGENLTSVTNELLSSLEAIANEVRVYVVSKKTREPKEGEFYNEVSVDMDLKCNSSSLNSFLYRLKSSEKLYTVRTLRIDAPDNNLELRVSLEISGFALLPKKTVGFHGEMATTE